MHFTVCQAYRIGRGENVKLIFRILLSAVLTVGVYSCSVRKMMVNEVAGIIGHGVSAFEQEDDLEMLEQAFPANMKLLEALLENNPDNSGILVLLARFYASYAFVFFQGKWEEAVLQSDKAEAGGGFSNQGRDSALKEAVNRYYIRGAEYALRALEVRHKEGREQLKNVKTRDPFFKKLGKADVPALFWYGFNLGAYINLNRDSIKAISMAHLAEKAMKRVIEIDPSYNHGNAHLFLLTYYASRPPMLGGNLDSAQSHYKQLKDLAGDDFLLADLYYARYYLHQRQEREKYRQVLDGILHHPGGRKSYRLYNKVAVNRAKLYLEAIDRLFD